MTGHVKMYSDVKKTLLKKHGTDFSWDIFLVHPEQWNFVGKKVGIVLTVDQMTVERLCFRSGQLKCCKLQKSGQIGVEKKWTVGQLCCRSGQLKGERRRVKQRQELLLLLRPLPTMRVSATELVKVKVKNESNS